MPELPDLLHVLARLREKVLGRRVVSERLREPVVLRCLVQGNLSLLLGRTLTDIQRHAHFLVFRFEGLDLAVSPMLAGRFKFAAPGLRHHQRLLLVDLETALAEALCFRLFGLQRLGVQHVLFADLGVDVPPGHAVSGAVLVEDEAALLPGLPGKLWQRFADRTKTLLAADENLVVKCAHRVSPARQSSNAYRRATGVD